MTTQPPSVQVETLDKHTFRLTLERTFRGFITGIATSKNGDTNEVTVAVYLDNKSQASDAVTLVADPGVDVELEDGAHSERKYWSFGPYKRAKLSAVLEVSVKHGPNGNATLYSDIFSPTQIHKKAESDYPIEFYSSVVLAGQGTDNEVTLNLLQYFDTTMNAGASAEAEPEATETTPAAT